MNDGLKNK